MLSGEIYSDILRTISDAMRVPVLVILVFFMAAAVFLLGSVAVEFFTERTRLKAKLPELADKLRLGGNSENIINESGLLIRQKAALIEVCRRPDLTPSMREALAIRLIRIEREHYEGIVRVSDLLSRLSPMCGLLGTLIPLGPGIIALGRGDTYTLSTSLLTAFDTTIAGIIAAALALVISSIRKKWYGSYMASLEMVMECLLETLSGGDETNEA